MKRIVVGVDESVAAERALDRALLEGHVTGRPVTLLHAWSPPYWMGTVPGEMGVLALATHDAEQQAGRLVEEVAAKAAARHDDALAVTTEVVQSHAGHALTEAGQDAALLVVGSRGVSRLAGALLGSTAQYVLHHAHCPVMLVPDPGPPAGPVQRVVVGADGSAASRSAMRWALDAARRHDCPLIVMHAWLLSSLPGRPSMHYVPSLREFESEAQEWLAQEIGVVLPDTQGVDVRPELSHSAASWALLDKAGPDDLLVVGSRGRGGFVELLLGSVATQVAQHARGVAVVVRAHEEHLEP